jgi:hypothetical protein
MYIWSALGEPTASKGYQPPISSAERNVTENDAQHIFTILAGPSRWQSYLKFNVERHIKDLPSRPMRIVNDSEFAKQYKRIFGTAPSANARGFVDRRNATIYLSEFPARNFGQSKAGLALHEAVHLFSHPPGKSKNLRATVYALLEEGLLEGLTQMITEDIQTAQGIRPLRDDWRAYRKYIPVAARFLQAFTPAVVGDAYFCGKVTPLIDAITRRWTAEGLSQVRRLANQEKTEEALQAIDALEQAHSQRTKPRAIQFRQVFR